MSASFDTSKKHAPNSLGAVLILGLGKSGVATAQYCAALLGSRVSELVIAAGEVKAIGTPDELRARAGHENLEDAFVQLIGSEEGLHA